jgi:hypothetical protein
MAVQSKYRFHAFSRWVADKAVAAARRVTVSSSRSVLLLSFGVNCLAQDYGAISQV